MKQNIVYRLKWQMVFFSESSNGNMDTNDEDAITSPRQPVSLIPYAIQLQNVVPIDIAAKRFPVDFVPETEVHFGINISSLSLDSEHQQAQVIIETNVEPVSEPKSFEIMLQVVGLFTYPQKYSPDEVQEYLQSGSIGAILPFIREVIFHLSTRLQIPPIMLPIIQLATPLSTEQPE